jgi:hypothetical protein
VELTRTSWTCSDTKRDVNRFAFRTLSPGWRRF